MPEQVNQLASSVRQVSILPAKAQQLVATAARDGSTTTQVKQLADNVKQVNILAAKAQ